MNRTIQTIILAVSIIGLGTAQEVTKSLKFEMANGVLNTSIRTDHINKNDLGEYFILTGITDGDFYIGQDTFLWEAMPENDEDDVTFLIKLSPNLELIKAVQLRGVRRTATDFSVSNSKVFVSDQNYDQYKYVDDVRVELDEDMHGAIYEFDHDLNFIGVPFQLKQRIKHIEAGLDSTLFINAILDSRDTMAYNGDTIFNFWHPLFGGSTNSIINFNHVSKEVKHFWKYGTQNDDTSVNLKVDPDGDVYVGSKFGNWKFSIDGETVIDNMDGETDCIIKFSPDGEELWSTYDPYHNPTTINQMEVLDSEEVLASYSYGSSSYISITGDTIYAAHDENHTGDRSALVKYDSLGHLTWIYTVDAFNLETGGPFRNNRVYGDTLEVLLFINRCDSIVLGSNVYTDVYRDQAFIYLNIHTGEVLDGYVLEKEDDMSINVPEYIFCNFVERFEDSKMVRIIYSFVRAESELYDQTWGESGVSSQYIFELDGEMLSQVNRPIQPLYFHLYPNPVTRGSHLTIDISSDIAGNVILIDATGKTLQTMTSSQLIRQGSTMNTETLTPGPYFLQYSTSDSAQTELFIIE